MSEPDPEAAPVWRPASGGLTLAATPIGNPLDASQRLVLALRHADVIAAEDTRRTKRLISDLGITEHGRLVAVHDHNESAAAIGLVEQCQSGAAVVMVSDAGMPTVSDPGYAVVQACVEAAVPIAVLPGPSAALMALALSGMGTDRFSFEGFLPRKAGERSRALAALSRDTRTMIFFEAPHRTADTLTAMAEAFGAERPAAMCRELTKTYEEVRRGTLAEHIAWAQGEVRGEITIVVAGANTAAADPASLVPEVLARVAAGERMKAVTSDLAATAGVSARELYALVLAAKKDG